VKGLDPEIDIPTLRAALLARKREMTDVNSTGEVSYVEEDRQITVRDGSSITVRIHKPKTASKDGCLVFVVYHGGGYVLGGLDNEALLCRNFTKLRGIAVNVDYRLAPEHPFPLPIEDAYDALKWVRTQSPTWRRSAKSLDCSKFRRARRQSMEGLSRWRDLCWWKLWSYRFTSLPGRKAISTLDWSISFYTSLHAS
jgi:hypothetical protein